MLFLICVPILFAVASARSEIKSVSHYNVKRLVRRDIKDYNHPPSVLSVPVSLVYEDENPMKGQMKDAKSLQASVSGLENKDVDDVTTTESSTPTEITTNKILKAHFSVRDEIDTERHLDSEYIIPVAVIYDEEPNITKRPKTSNKSKIRNRQERNQKLDKSNKKVTTENKTEATSQEKTPGRTEFPKRTEGRDPVVPIVQSENYVFANSGDFHYSYEGGDGTKAFMRGELRSLDEDKAGTAVEGSFSYIGKDGNDYSLTYTADENGYRPIGAHLPTPPPIPPAIARALKYLATKTTPEPVTKSL